MKLNKSIHVKDKFTEYINSLTHSPTPKKLKYGAFFG